ncbi:Glyoxalase/Bleomycin resistance protein/Dioxygenase superfamily protein [Calidithermus terrae]|uniref:Glyoxalase/Bleomycin resistance protein/Dioxygenase superfamily protein n=1 Tax=Calidithermus terrae TaxID=1408545 RepID=A0A399EEE0_9DEIN|nr:VOC family protein [Calidithermus terrae]RIH82146.1 Glyoxalase/Bleomycin resistance protein/Dioxygenase superfamily protein [Calidithermus terrae]
MVTRQSHTTIYVLDQDKALEFYQGILGLEVRTDMRMDNGFRWLTVGPKAQPDLEIVLMPVKAGQDMDAETAERIRGLLEKGAMGVGVFETDDIHRDYAEWSAKGVHFVSPPKEQFYGVEALVRDNSGNWFSLTQRKKG